MSMHTYETNGQGMAQETTATTPTRLDALKEHRASAAAREEELRQELVEELREKEEELKAVRAEAEAREVALKATIGELRAELGMDNTEKPRARAARTTDPAPSFDADARSPRERILGYLRHNPPARSEIVAKGTGLSGPDVSKELKKMVAEGVATRVGDRRATVYSLVGE